MGQEYSLEDGMATHSSILVWKIPWDEEPDGLQLMEWQSIRHNLATKHTHIQELTVHRPPIWGILWKLSNTFVSRGHFPLYLDHHLNWDLKKKKKSSLKSYSTIVFGSAMCHLNNILLLVISIYKKQVY